MSNAIELYESISVTVEQEANCCPVTREVGRRGLWVTLAGSALIGIWAVVCLVGGLCSCESVAMLKRSLFMALTGM